MSRDLTQEEYAAWKAASKNYTELQLIDEPLPTINDYLKMEAEANAGLQ